MPRGRERPERDADGGRGYDRREQSSAKIQKGDRQQNEYADWDTREAKRHQSCSAIAVRRTRRQVYDRSCHCQRAHPSMLKPAQLHWLLGAASQCRSVSKVADRTYQNSSNPFFHIGPMQSRTLVNADMEPKFHARPISLAFEQEPINQR